MEKSFEDLIIELQPDLKRFAFKLTKDSEMSDDLVQDTIYKAIKKKNTWSSGTNLKAWLFTILKNNFINDYRRIKSSCIDNYEDLFILNTIQENGVNNPESLYSEKEILIKIEQLKDIYKTPFKMFIEGYKYEEISEKLNIKLGTIKSRIFFARKELMHNLIDNQLIITTMNDISKTNVKQRLEVAMHKETLTAVSVAAVLGIKSEYISLIKNPKTWDKCPPAAWDIVLEWVNSGQPLMEYGHKHGRFAKDEITPIKKTEPVKIVPEKKEIVSEPLKIDANLHDLATYPRKNMIEASDIKSDPELLKEAEGLREKITLIDLLKERRVALIEETNAIDNLLRHYTRLMPSPWK